MTALEILSHLDDQSMFDQVLRACDSIDTYLRQKLRFSRPEGRRDDELLGHFRSLNSADQAQLYRSVLGYHNLICAEIDKGTDLADDLKFTRASLHALGIKTSEAIYGYIGEGSVIEHFTLDFRQTWRSVSFFKYSSYPMKTLILRPFPLNFKKDPSRVEGQIVSALEQLANGDALFLTDITEEHQILEVDSPLKIKNVGRARFVAPTYLDGRRHGIISVIDVKESVATVPSA